MRQPPPLSSASHYPATAATAIGAAALSVAWWGGMDLDHLTAPLVGLESLPWTLFTSTLLHVGVLHLLFNLYWLWVFGTAIEQVYGTARTAGLYLFLAALAGVVEYVLYQRGVGLSGVGYGLFTLLWVLGRRRPRFADAVDRSVVLLFVGWFFLCVVMTYTAGWRIGNIAHLAGALVGAATGAAIAERRKVRYAARVGLVVACVVAGWMAFNARVPVAFTVDEQRELSYDLLATGSHAYNDERYGDAIKAYEAAIDVWDGGAQWWYQLGAAYQAAGRDADARRAYQRAAELAPNDAEIAGTYRQFSEWRRFAEIRGEHREQLRELAASANVALEQGDVERAVDLLEEAVTLWDEGADLWFNLGVAYQRAGRLADAERAYQRAAELAPDDEKIVEQYETFAAWRRENDPTWKPAKDASDP